MKKSPLLFGLICLLPVLPRVLRAQNDSLASQPVTATGTVSGHNCILMFNGTTLAEGTDAVSETSSWSFQLTPGKTYYAEAEVDDLNSFVQGVDFGAFNLTFKAPPGYTVYLQRAYTTDPLVETPSMAATSNVPGSGLSIKWAVQLRADAWDTPVRAGRIARLNVGDLIFELGLGTLANGKSAGRLILRSGGVGLGFAPGNLIYDSPDQTAQLTPNGDFSQYTLILPQTRVVAAEAGTGSYTISFYAGNGSGGYGSTAYAVYTVAPATSGLPAHAPSGANGLKITEQQGTGSSAVTVEHYVFDDGSSGTWTLIEGGGGDERIETHTSSTSGGVRTEVVTVQDGNLTTLNKERKTWTTLNNVAMLTKDEVWSDPGTTNPDLTTQYSYYGSGSNPGQIYQLHEVTYPNGATKTYDYYNDEDDGRKLGEVKTVTEPWGDGTSSQVTTYDYTGPTGAYESYLDSTVVTIGSTTVAKATSTYSFASDHYTETTSSYGDASNALTTVTTAYRQDADYFKRDRPLTVKSPSGRQQGYYYEPGAYSGGTFTPGAGGPATRTWAVTGTQHTGTGITTTSSINGLTFADAIGLVANQSTLTEVVRDGQDTVLSTRTYVWDGSAWDTAHPIVATTTSWSDAVHESSQTALNGAETDWTWSGTDLASQTDAGGVEQTYSYDSVGRVSAVTRTALGAAGGYQSYAAVTTTYGYDAANRKVSMTETGGSLGRTTTYTYDGAGRPTGSTLPDGRVMSASYSILSGGVTQTVETLSCGGTITTQKLRDGKLKQVTGDTKADQYHTYSVDGGTGKITATVHYASSGSSRWEATTTDWLGRTVTQEKPGYTGQPDLTVTTTYDGTTGLATKISRTGLADEYRSYDDLGQLIRDGYDLGNNGSLSTSDTADRVTDYATQFSKSGSDWWAERTQSTYPSGTTALVISTQLTRLTGLGSGTLAETKSEDVHGNVVDTVTTLDRPHRRVTVTTTYPGISATAVTVTNDGLTAQQTGTDGRSMTSTYDDLGRLYQQTDSRTGATTYTYLTHGGNATDQVYTVTDPAGAVTTYGYDTGGRVDAVENASGDYAYYTYDCHGRLTRQWGGALTPVERVYDDYSQVTALHTYRSGTWTGSTWPGGTADVTSYTYDGPSGLLTQQQDAAGHDVNYTYNSRGLVATRAWARLNSSSQRVTTTYSYLSLSTELTGKSYNDGTPAVSFTYSRLGQMTSATDVSDGSTVEERDFAYNGDLQLVSETLPSYLGSRVITYTYQDGSSGTVAGRSSGYELGTSASPGLDLVIGLGYDGSTGNVAALTATPNGVSARSFAYGYASNSSLVTGVSQSGLGYTQSRAYETHRDLLTQSQTVFGSTTWAQYDHTYNTLGQRDSAKQSGDAFADYGDATFYRYTYDSRGQLIQAAGYLGGDVNTHGSGNALPERDFEYAYDQAGNRTSANRSGIAALAASYTINALNQITARDNPYVTVWATADPGAKVLINGNLAGQRGNYWAGEAVLDNTSGPAYASIPVKAATVSPETKQTTSVNGFLAPFTESFTYDADGNLTADGQWDYTYDAENRLIEMQTDSTAMAAGLPGKRLIFRYDSLGRRTAKQVWTYSGSTWTESKDTRFIYQGWNLIAELNLDLGTSTLSLARSYAWGLDMSGSLSAMGGVGALVQITDYTGATTSYLPGYDGSGNLAVLVKDDGTLSATYEYSPLGESLRKEGTYADENPFRFSTKYTDEETGLVYYGHRYYSPSLGRFLNQDPAGVAGGVNLYAFAGNDPVNGWDYLGLVNQATADPAAYFASLSPEEQARQQMLWQTFSGGLALMDAMDAARTSYSGLWIVASPATAASSGDFSEASRARDAEAQRAAADWARILATPGSWSVLSIGADAGHDTVVIGPLLVREADGSYREARTTATTSNAPNSTTSITAYQLPNGNWVELGAPGQAGNVVKYAPDGKLTLGEANSWYRNGNGVPVVVDATLYDFSQVNPNGFSPGNRTQLYTFPKFQGGLPSQDFLVNGTVTLQLNGDGQTFTIRPDTYDFDIHYPIISQPVRNVETIIAGGLAGNGIPFDIIFSGSVRVPPPPPPSPIK